MEGQDSVIPKEDLLQEPQGSVPQDPPEDASEIGHQVPPEEPKDPWPPLKSAGAQLLAVHSECFQPHYEDRTRLNSQKVCTSYTRGCHVSPDGLCVLTAASDNKLRIFEVADVLEQKPDGSTPVDFPPCLTMQEGEIVYDYTWFPLMDSTRPDLCCFAVTAQYQPIHLYDAFDGHLRASYRCFNQLDEMVAANSVAFDASGTKLYAGLKGEIRVFDVSIPGRDCLEIRKTWTREMGGQTGIISCIATNPYLTNVYALGSFSRTLGVYLEPKAQLLCLLEGQKGGITHVKFSADGSKLLAGGRKDDEILVWDMRNPGSIYCVLKRKVTTNQRIYFDTHPTDANLVVSGSTDGRLLLWDLSQPSSTDSADPVILESFSGAGLHGDCVNGVSFHPKMPVVASSTGQRHLHDPECFNSSDDDEEDSSEAKVRGECKLRVWKFR